jgi:hypothetical protein
MAESLFVARPTIDHGSQVGMPQVPDTTHFNEPDWQQWLNDIFASEGSELWIDSINNQVAQDTTVATFQSPVGQDNEALEMYHSLQLYLPVSNAVGNMLKIDTGARHARTRYRFSRGSFNRILVRTRPGISRAA